MANYNYVVDASYNPFSLQEMLVPFTAYKDAYEKDEERYLELQQKAGDLEAVINTLPEDSNVRKQYEQYYNDLKTQAEDFSHNGKTMMNSRGLLNLRRRYQGEIGSIEKANNALNDELKLRRTIMAQDPTMIYQNDNPTLENYMPGAKRNDYSISGNFLASEGAKMGEALSKRKFTAEDGKANILGGYYADFVQRTGIQDTTAFMQSEEFANAMRDDLASKGVYDNLSGANLQRAIDSYRSGALKGFVYQEQHSPQRDLGVPDWGQKMAQANADRTFNYNLWREGDSYDAKTGKFTHDPNGNIALQDKMAYAEAVAKLKTDNKGTTGTTGSKSTPSEYQTQLSNRVKISWKGNNPNNVNGDADDDYEVTTVDSDETSHPGAIYDYDSLPQYAKDKVDKLVGDGSVDHYEYYFKPYKGGFFNDSEAELELVPKKIVKDNKEDMEMLDFGAS